MYALACILGGREGRPYVAMPDIDDMGNFLICMPIARSQHRYGFFSPKLWRYIAAGHPSVTISFDEYGIVIREWHTRQLLVCLFKYHRELFFGARVGTMLQRRFHFSPQIWIAAQSPLSRLILEDVRWCLAGLHVCCSKDSAVLLLAEEWVQRERACLDTRRKLRR
jgi:hypothetical protein